MIRFVLLATQRTGSSFLASCLDSHPEISCFEELFMPRNRNNVTYRAYRRASLGRLWRHLFAQRRLINDYLDQLGSTVPPGNRAWGFNIMYGQLQKYPACVSWCQHNDVHVVHLVRKNALKVIVSREVAKKRRGGDRSAKVYLSTKPVQRTTIALPVSSLIGELDRLTRSVEAHRKLFRDTGPYLEVHYESLTSDQQRETCRVLDFLGAEQRSLHSPFVKTSPDSLPDIIENFNEVRNALKNSRYEDLVH